MMSYLFVARTHGACVNTPNFDACVHTLRLLLCGVEKRHYSAEKRHYSTASIECRVPTFVYKIAIKIIIEALTMYFHLPRNLSRNSKYSYCCVVKGVKGERHIHTGILYNIREISWMLW